jgi:hypothetical protein
VVLLAMPGGVHGSAECHSQNSHVARFTQVVIVMGWALPVQGGSPGPYSERHFVK